MIFNKRHKYKWQGINKNINDDKLNIETNCLMALQTANGIEDEPSLMDLLNIDAVRIYDNKSIDLAKELSNMYFGGCMINSLEDNLRTFLGIKLYELPREVLEIKKTLLKIF